MESAVAGVLYGLLICMFAGGVWVLYRHRTTFLMLWVGATLLWIFIFPFVIGFHDLQALLMGFFALLLTGVVLYVAYRASLPPKIKVTAEPVGPFDINVAIDATTLRPPPQTIEAFKKIAVFMLKDNPEDAEQLFDAYKTFVTWLPSELLNQRETDFTVISPFIDSHTVEALWRLSMRAPGILSDALRRKVVAIEDREQPDTINLKKIRQNDIPSILEVVRSDTHFGSLIDTLTPTVEIPTKSRFEGTFILGPPGSGKTTLIEYLATKDMKDAAACVIVIDSQSTIIKELSSLKQYQDRIILVEPGSVAINPFSMKGEVGVDLITFILGALGGEGAAFTSKQSAFYRPCVRLLQEVPNATFIDFVKLLQPGGLAEYVNYVPNLSQTVQLFFNNEFNAKPNTVKEELLWRLRPITEDPVYERMFCSPTTKLDLFKEMDAGKIILIDTNKQELQATRSSLFGRMFVAFIYRAAMQRKAGNHSNVFCYIDESHEYLQDEQIADMLDELRKRQVAITLATQRLDKVKSVNMKSALMTTAVKYIRAGNDSDAHTMAREVRLEDASFLLKLQPQTFALFVRDVTPQAIAVNVPHFDIKNMEHVPTDDLRRRMKDQYGPDTASSKPTEAPKPSGDESEPPGDTKPQEW